MYYDLTSGYNCTCRAEHSTWPDPSFLIRPGLLENLIYFSPSPLGCNKYIPPKLFEYEGAPMAAHIVLTSQNNIAYTFKANLQSHHNRFDCLEARYINMHLKPVRQRLAQTTMAAPRPSSDNSTSICGHDNLPAAWTAASPFDDPKADLIIRSSNNILFHKSLLSIVSPVFEAMFALPHDTSQELYDNCSCVPVSDDSRHLFCLLSQCDPRC